MGPDVAIMAAVSLWRHDGTHHPALISDPLYIYTNEKRLIL